MTLLTWSELLNSNAIVIDDPSDVPSSITPANPAVLIPLSALSNGKLNLATSMASPEKVLTAIMERFADYNALNPTSINFLEVARQEPALARRDGANYLSFGYATTAFQLTTEQILVDPDNLDVINPVA